MRPLLICLVLSGCSAGTISAYSVAGVPVTMPLFLQPFCLIICTSSVQSSGSTATTTGEGAIGGSNTQSQSSTQTSTGNVSQ